MFLASRKNQTPSLKKHSLVINTSKSGVWARHVRGVRIAHAGDDVARV